MSRKKVCYNRSMFKYVNRFAPILFFFFGFFIFLLNSNQTFAATNDLPSITVLNAIRGQELGHDNEDLLPGLEAQWNATHELGINATWLWQYSALENQPLVDFAKKEMTNQEFGLFLEIDRNFTLKSGVGYRGRGPWYFSDGLLLVSYDKEERQKLIDTAFAKFKQTFGYYPKTVGSWWIGADSIDYMQKKYGITSAMKASDQYDLDKYTLWGSPWGISYLASKENEGIPAESFDKSSKVVIMQWASRDPLLAYGNTPYHGLYSIQDFHAQNYDMPYFSYLLSIYLQKPLDHILLGLENSKPDAFMEGLQYQSVLQTAKTMQDNGKINILLAKDYADSFLAKRIVLAPTNTYIAKDFSSNDQAFWAQSPNYRLSIQKRGNLLYLVDIRNYAVKTPEEFFTLPNGQGELRIDAPAIIDSASFPEQYVPLRESTGELHMTQKNGQTILYSGDTKIAEISTNSANIFTPNGKTLTFSFSANKSYPSLFSIILIFFALYSLTFIFISSNKKTAIFECGLLFIPLFLAHDFFTKNAFTFDKKQLYLSYFLLIPKVSLSAKIAIFESLPIFLLPIFHFVSLIWKKKFIFIAYLIFLTIIFIHLPYFPLDKSTYKMVGAALGLIALVIIFAGTALALKMKSKKIALLSLLSVVLIFIVTGMTLFVSRSKDVLAPFELSALETVYANKKEVLYLFPETKPIYKATRPLMFDDFSFAKRLTQTNWKIVSRDAKHNLVMPSDTNAIVFVPRYLGSYIYPEEIDKYHLKKIFENQQIALFEK